MKSIFYLLDSAPYGSEKAFAILNASIVSLSQGVTLGLYADGVYLGLAGQDSRLMHTPCLADLIYAYPEMKVLAHEPSMLERCLLSQNLIERVELADEEDFLNAIEFSQSLVLL
jgi:tRNA 2-thiouridine synthesizing protein C